MMKIHRLLLVVFSRIVVSDCAHSWLSSRPEWIHDVKVTEYNLGKTCESDVPCPEDKWGLDLYIDLYQPSAEQRRGSNLRGRQLSDRGGDDDLPFLLFTCGGPADKSQYSRYATAMAHRGYNIAVMNKALLMMSPGTASTQEEMRLNAVTPVDINRVIQYVQSNEALGIDTNSVVLVGHSFGGATVLAAARGFCYSFFCGTGPPNMTATDQNFSVDLSSSVIGALTYGVSIYQVGFPGEPKDTELTNVNKITGATMPLFLFWGEHDKAVNSQRDGEYIYRTTWENQEETKAYAIGEGMDHDSIANQPFSGRNVVNSTLPRRTQIYRTVTVTDAWVKYLIRNEDIKSRLFCFKLGIPLMEDAENRNECKLDA